MTTLPKAAIEAAAKAAHEYENTEDTWEDLLSRAEKETGWSGIVKQGRGEAEASILAALPYLGEPVAWQRKTGVFSWTPVDAEDIPHYQSMGQEIRPLFVAPPAPAVSIKDGE